MKRSRVFLMITSLLLIGLACSTFSGGTENNNSEAPNNSNSGNPSDRPTTTPALSSTDDAAPSEEESISPVSYEEILTTGIDTGHWSQEEGFLLILKYFLGEITAEQLPGATEVVVNAGTGIFRKLNEFLQSPDLDPAVKIELELLYRRIFPPHEVLEHISERKGSHRPNTLGSIDPISSKQTQASCQDLSSLGYDEDDVSQMSESCYYYQEKTFQSHIFRVYYPFWWHGDGPYKPIIDATFAGLLDAAQTYSNYQGLEIGSVNLVFPIEGFFDYLGAQTTFEPENSDCPLMMSESAYDALGEAVFKQVVAHEMFHCVQDFSFPNTSPYDDHSWWLEGSADYFSNLVYPETDEEWGTLDSFNRKSANKSIFDMSYENFIFFQFMGNKYSPQTVVDTLHSISAAGTKSNQQTALASVPKMETNFNLFVVEFLSTGVLDSGGGSITVSNPTITGKNSVEDQGEHAYSTSPFVATRYQVDFKKEKRFLQEDISGDGGSFSAAEKSGFKNIGNWSDLPPEVRSYCKEDLPYYYAVTTTRDSNYDFKANVTLAEKASCDPCLLGVWAVDNDSFEDYILRIAGEVEVPGEAGEFTMEIEGFNYIEFRDDAKMFTRRDQFSITTGVSNVNQAFTTVIDSQGEGTYSADGEKIQVFNLSDHINSINAFVDGLPISINQTGGSNASTVTFFGVSGGGPGIISEDGPENASATYVCEKETMTITQQKYGDLLFNRVEKIMPTPVPTPGP